MGLSASQSRMLALFGRRSDTEHQVQQVNNKRTVLANLTAEASRQYAEKAGNRSYKYQVNTGTNSSYYKDYDGNDFIKAYAAATNAAGDVTSDYKFTWTDATGQQVEYTREQLKKLSPAVIYDLLNSETFEISKKNAQLDAAGNVVKDATGAIVYTDEQTKKLDENGDEVKDPTTGAPVMVTKNFKPDLTTWEEGLYTADDQKAAAVYQTKTAEYQAQDKRLENEIKNLDTQHQAIQTEIDAVKKVIDKDIEMTFKTFA